MFPYFIIYLFCKYLQSRDEKFSTGCGMDVSDVSGVNVHVCVKFSVSVCTKQRWGKKQERKVLAVRP